jgi:DNA-binding MarR family transcriptional regulator
MLTSGPEPMLLYLVKQVELAVRSMADMITTLEGRGLIVRHRDRVDRRRLVVALTADGRELLDRYRDQVTALEAGMLAGLTEAEISSLRRILRACHANLAGHPVSRPSPSPSAAHHH